MNCALPRRGHAASLGRKGSSPRRRGLPRLGSVRLGDPENRKWGVSDPPRRGFSPLGEGRLHLSEPVTVFMAYHDLFGIDFMARFMIVCGLLRGHYMTCLRVSLLD